VRREDIEARFTYRSPTDEAKAAHAAVRQACIAAALVINDQVPEGREHALAITNLQQVLHWANTGIALNHDKLPVTTGG